MSELLPNVAMGAVGRLGRKGSSARFDLPNHIHVITPRELVMTWLAHGVPLALIADLADPSGPASRQIYAAECVDDDVRRDAETLDAPASLDDLDGNEHFSAPMAG